MFGETCERLGQMVGKCLGYALPAALLYTFPAVAQESRLTVTGLSASAVDCYETPNTPRALICRTEDFDFPQDTTRAADAARVRLIAKNKSEFWVNGGVLRLVANAPAGAVELPAPTSNVTAEGRAVRIVDNASLLFGAQKGIPCSRKVTTIALPRLPSHNTRKIRREEAILIYVRQMMIAQGCINLVDENEPADYIVSVVNAVPGPSGRQTAVIRDERTGEVYRINSFTADYASAWDSDNMVPVNAGGVPPDSSLTLHGAVAAYVSILTILSSKQMDIDAAAQDARDTTHQ